MSFEWVFIGIPGIIFLILGIVGYKKPSTVVAVILGLIAAFCILLFMLEINIPHLIYGLSLLGYVFGTSLKVFGG